MSDARPVILVDISGSMLTLEGSRTRIAILEDILQRGWPEIPTARVIAFGSLAEELVGLEPGASLRLPPAGGSTNLSAALELIARGAKPTKIIVVSDGRPDSAPDALSAARALAPVEISVFYCGGDNDPIALGFMRALSLAGGSAKGISGPRRLSQAKELADEVLLLLSGPAR
jgi:hypothetical protein